MLNFEEEEKKVVSFKEEFSFQNKNLNRSCNTDFTSKKKNQKKPKKTPQKNKTPKNLGPHMEIWAVKWCRKEKSKCLKLVLQWPNM